MQTHVPISAEANKQQSYGAQHPAQLLAEQQSSFDDHSPRAAQLTSLQATMSDSPPQQRAQAMQAKMNGSAQVQQMRTLQARMAGGDVAQREELEEPLQAQVDGGAVQREEVVTASEASKPNNTGLPDNLKSGIESLSGMSMDHVKVHYNSSQPAQLNAHAYAQGSEIHVAPGQEQHVPHEAWHVVQQAQGRVRPTIQMKAGVAVNDDLDLEQEADVMGRKAMGLGETHFIESNTLSDSKHGLPKTDHLHSVSQQKTSISKGVTSRETVQMNKVLKAEESEKTIDQIVDLMEPRALGAAADMLWDFKEIEEDFRYFVATNEALEEDERFGLMSLKTPPEVKAGELEGENPAIDSSLWVEGLVADPGSGLGALLLTTAEEIAQQEEKSAVAMAAYEYDPKDRDEEGTPYSIAPYYENKKGYSYTGDAYEEVDEDTQESYFYPIYSKPIVQLKSENISRDEKILQGSVTPSVVSGMDVARTTQQVAEGLNKSPHALTSQIAQLRSQQVVQREFAWSNFGADGVLIGDDEQYVIKLAGYDAMAISIDQLAARFGFTASNARIVREGGGEWGMVLRAVSEGGGWNRTGDGAPQTEALVMDKLAGKPLHETEEELNAEDPKKPTEAERLKIERMCSDLGKMLVLDLITRNNDRFNLVDFDDEVLSTEAEKTMDEDEWRRWMGNEGNILIDIATGSATPIDSQFTDASDEPQYAQNVAHLLINRRDDLVNAGMSFLPHNWANEPYASAAFKQGIEIGIQRLLAL